MNWIPWLPPFCRANIPSMQVAFKLGQAKTQPAQFAAVQHRKCFDKTFFEVLFNFPNCQLNILVFREIKLNSGQSEFIRLFMGLFNRSVLFKHRRPPLLCIVYQRIWQTLVRSYSDSPLPSRLHSIPIHSGSVLGIVLVHQFGPSMSGKLFTLSS